MVGLDLGYGGQDAVGSTWSLVPWYLFFASPFLVLGALVWRAGMSNVAVAIALAVAVIVVSLGFHTAWTDDSSTAGFALGVAPVYALGGVGAIYLLDRLIRLVRGRQTA